MLTTAVLACLATLCCDCPTRCGDTSYGFCSLSKARKRARDAIAKHLAGWAVRKLYLRKRRAAAKVQATRRMAVHRRKYKVRLAEGISK